MCHRIDGTSIAVLPDLPDGTHQLIRARFNRFISLLKIYPQLDERIPLHKAPRPHLTPG